VAMVELAIADNPAFELGRLEVDRTGPSYTVDTLRELRTREPGVEFALLVGADAAAELPTWREAEAIPGLATVIAFARQGTPAAGDGLVARTIPVPTIDISATEIRRRVAAGLSIRYWVPEAVAEYIAAHGLYHSGEG